MNDSEFPNEIDLGREVPDYSAEVAPAKKGKKEKTTTSYPTLYISGMEGLEALTGLKDGACVMIKVNPRGFHKDVRDGKTNYSVELEVTKLCLPEGMGSEDDEDETKPIGEEDFGLDEAADKVFGKKKADKDAE